MPGKRRGKIAHVGERRGTYRVWVGKLREARSLGRPRSRSEYNIKMGLEEVEREDMDWIDLPQNRDRWCSPLKAVMNIRIPESAGSFFTSSGPVCFSKGLFSTELRGKLLKIIQSYHSRIEYLEIIKW
jgi:hypothetical protein